MSLSLRGGILSGGILSGDYVLDSLRVLNVFHYNHFLFAVRIGLVYGGL